MPKPEVWGPPVWTLFHVLIEKLHEDAYHKIGPPLFKMFVRICKNLPCPECSKDATKFLAKIKIADLKNKSDLKNTFYIFHNYVNTRKRSPLFNFSKMDNYKKYNILHTINRFIQHYHTNGNMQLLNESFQRKFVVRDFKSFIKKNILAFIHKNEVPLLLSNKNPNKNPNKIDDENKKG